jgi:hypothetical protein
MKFATLLALGLISTVNAIDFDGDGIDDTPEDAEDEEDEGNRRDPEWYEEEEFEDLKFDDLEKVKKFTFVGVKNLNMVSDADGTDELGIINVKLYNNDQFVEKLFEVDYSSYTNFKSGWYMTNGGSIPSF